MLPSTRDKLRKSVDFKCLVLDVISNTIKESLDDLTTGSGVKNYADSLLLKKCYYWIINNGIINTASESTKSQAKAEYVAAILTLFDSESEEEGEVLIFKEDGSLDFDSSFPIMKAKILEHNYLYLLAGAVTEDYFKTEYDEATETWSKPIE